MQIAIFETLSILPVQTNAALLNPSESYPFAAKPEFQASAAGPA
jgi:hypothetical protein